MHITKEIKETNGTNEETWKVETKDNKTYYVKEFKEAIKLAFQLGGLIND